MFTRPIAVIDLETTGTSTTLDRIVEIAVVRIEVDGTRTTRVRRVNPERPIPAEVTEIHGINDDMVKDEPTFTRIAKGVLDFIRGCDIAGFNSNAFDVPMLYEHFARAGLTWEIDTGRTLDAGVIYKVMEPRDLATAVRYYLGHDHEGAHGARADAEATADVLLAQVKKYNRFTSEEEVFLASRYDQAPPVDVGGKLARDADDDLVYAFGSKKGTKVRDDVGYAKWMLRSDFPSHTRSLLVDELDRLERERL